MILEREDDGVRVHLERAVGDGRDRVLEQDAGGERVAVVDLWLAVLPVPAVQLHAAAALRQGLRVHAHRAVADELTFLEGNAA